MIFDTTFLIELARDKTVLKKFANVQLQTTQICAFEILVGAYRTNTVPQISALLEQFEILELNSLALHHSALLCAKALENGTPVGHSDCLIAGIAKAHNQNQIVTKNQSHFRNLGLKTLSY
ncbi:MAG: type II toxin-antitoxin system VapC family toxin [Candidatus Woesearchaeota archaeon]